MKAYDSSVLRGDEANTRLAETLALQDEIMSIQGGLASQEPRKDTDGIIRCGDGEIRQFSGFDRIVKEQGIIGDRIQAMIDAGELPERSHRLKNKRRLQIEIIALIQSIKIKKIEQRRNPRIKAKGISGINVRDVNSQVDVLAKLRNRKEVKEKISFRFKGKNIVIFFGEKIRVEVDGNTQESLGELPIRLIELINTYNSL